jgi:hypothetical protein
MGASKVELVFGDNARLSQAHPSYVYHDQVIKYIQSLMQASQMAPKAYVVVYDIAVRATTREMRLT